MECRPSMVGSPYLQYGLSLPGLNVSLPCDPSTWSTSPPYRAIRALGIFPTYPSGTLGSGSPWIPQEMPSASFSRFPPYGYRALGRPHHPFVCGPRQAMEARRSRSDESPKGSAGRSYRRFPPVRLHNPFTVQTLPKRGFAAPRFSRESNTKARPSCGRQRTLAFKAIWPGARRHQLVNPASRRGISCVCANVGFNPFSKYRYAPTRVDEELTMTCESFLAEVSPTSESADGIITDTMQCDTSLELATLSWSGSLSSTEPTSSCLSMRRGVFVSPLCVPSLFEAVDSDETCSSSGSFSLELEFLEMPDE